MDGQYWVERVGGLIMARVRGQPTETLLRACHARVIELAREAGEQAEDRVLYDTLEMDSPPVDVPLFQRKLDEELGGLRLRRAIVVPNSRLAYLARLAFGEGNYQVFYSDMTA